jgi:hypothetical protein
MRQEKFLRFQCAEFASATLVSTMHSSNGVLAVIVAEGD